MLEREIWLEIIVSAYVVRLARAYAPVLVVVPAVGLYIFPAKPLRALIMPLRRAEGREKQGMLIAETLADIQHI